MLKLTLGRIPRSVILAAAAAASALMVAFVMASPAGAVSTAASHSQKMVTTVHASAPVQTGRVCVIAATGFVRHGNQKVVTASSTRCYSSYSSYRAARREARASGTDSPLNSVNVGYGCDLQNFSQSDTCWYFAVSSNCTTGSYWVWNTLGAMNNDMQSWEPINTCNTGNVYYLTYQTGSSILCTKSSPCYSLGAINNHDESLRAKA